MAKNKTAKEYLVDEEKYKKLIGKFVKKRSGKPFKSGLKHNRVKNVLISPYHEFEAAFTFYEDTTIVECRDCELVQKLFYYL